ncbi:MULTISPECIES: hypothetical protein [Bradyrhizobium]|uniref:hypothetical protein n=1 Tax=Bradyrhizobium TaxID=374 RepID=UPI00114CC2C4|nr:MULTISPECIES: hypothetical protein [Bradyrhizobium]MCP1838876.1 hypothetical protein [Bradyrhizobium sp. USDA 4538]MCP1899443.1 hypothetical protein [Bradyrhizobium sp. USDA 4537]MCP1909721.1 hypothetical protein [Bradyrhizobium elkanii]MCP1986446.1 hypothetical protein [Bradyrhizobium sp. USDA 4539]
MSMTEAFTPARFQQDDSCLTSIRLTPDTIGHERRPLDAPAAQLQGRHDSRSLIDGISVNLKLGRPAHIPDELGAAVLEMCRNAFGIVTEAVRALERSVTILIKRELVDRHS